MRYPSLITFIMADPDAGHMQVLKYAYKTNFLSASEEAAAYEPFNMIELP